MGATTRSGTGGAGRAVLRMSTMDLAKLKELCKDYVWYIIMGLSVGRFAKHQELCDMIGIDHHDERLCDILSNLDKLGLSQGIRDREYWNRYTKKVGRCLYDKIVETF